MKNKDIILFVNSFRKDIQESIREYSHNEGKSYLTMLLFDSKWIKDPKKNKADIVVGCDFSKPRKIAEAIKPYKYSIKGITCIGERNIDSFQKVIPHVPYARTPNAMSLQWATNKVAMRELLSIEDKKLCPRFLVIHDSTQRTIESIKKKIRFPLVLKPAGLASSLLVTMCFHEDDVAKALKKMFRRIEKFYKEGNRSLQTTVLVEEFMDGEMYSIDAYVGNTGKIVFCPFVHVRTGRSIGFDDFFGYKQITPTTLSKVERDNGKTAAEKAIHALGLRNTTAHVELMKTDSGWKVIELGSRVGGFRHPLYKLSFGMNHRLNDVLIRLGKRPKTPAKLLGHSAILKLFAKKEGKLEKITGVRKIKKISSVQRMKVNKKIGESCPFAKHGGKSVLDVMLFNRDRSSLLADIRRVEQAISIDVRK